MLEDGTDVSNELRHKVRKKFFFQKYTAMLK